jgi:hypothetical protein
MRIVRRPPLARALERHDHEMQRARRLYLHSRITYAEFKQRRDEADRRWYAAIDHVCGPVLAPGWRKRYERGLFGRTY